MARLSMLFMAFQLQVALIALCVQATTNSTSAADDSIFVSADGANLGGYILAVVTGLVGGGITVFGYRFMYATVFVTGFALGAVGIAVTTERMLADTSIWSVGSWIAFYTNGAMCGGMAMWVYPKSNFITGVAGGITLAMVMTNSIACYISPGQTKELFTVFCMVFAVGFASFSLRYGKPVEIVGTSIFGAALLMWGVSFFANGFPFPNDLEKYSTRSANGDLVYAIPSAWWGYLGGIVVIAVFGMFIQFCKTGRSFSDDEYTNFGTSDFGHPIDIAAHVENEKQQPTSPNMHKFVSTTRNSEFSPASYPSVTHESFCQLYSRQTEAESISKMRSKFLEERAKSVEVKNALSTSTSFQPSPMDFP